ncbi:MAG: hypothetical protein KH354_03190 [Clostridiales bacterium]|nr:hypothetical protein [Clostridiales bacterium]
MKKFTVLAAILVVLLLMGTTAMAAPLENPNLDITQLNPFDGWTDGEVIQNSNYFWVFEPNGTGAFNNGLLVMDSADPELPFTARINLKEHAVSIEDMTDVTGVAFYVENNSEEEAGIGFFGESFGGFEVLDQETGGTKLAEHQLTYSNADFTEIVCYLVDLEGNIARCEEYYGYNMNGQASVPAGFKGWFLIDLANGGFNRCYYGSWGTDMGFHDSEDCEYGRFVNGTHGLLALGFSVCADLADGETVALGDYALWSAKSGFTMPEEGETSVATPSSDPTQQPTENPSKGTTATAAPDASESPAPASSNTILYIIIAAVVIAAVVAVIVIIAVKNKKKN